MLEAEPLTIVKVVNYRPNEWFASPRRLIVNHLHAEFLFDPLFDVMP
jgi:hypothetical protein